ncbi:MAG: nitrous oxide reductase family maturation protein NosD [Chloroflexi bacterium]|nr:MAG: nitrous oxide reductase family maturation protein NosD [Chloroflexota bacterium]
MRRRSSIVLCLVLAALLAPPRVAMATDTIVVCSTCAITTLQEALEIAGPGDRIEVRGGVYPGGLVIDHDLQLVGSEGAVIDGGGHGTIIRITGGNVLIQGWTIRGSGANLDREDTAIFAENARVAVLDNHIEDSLFGIYLKQAAGSVIRGNTIIAKPLGIAVRGDGIRVWYCDDMLIENNVASDGRDVILWYSNRGVVRNNTFDRGRYGLHLMFSDAAHIEANSLRANSIGLYIMYSRDPYVVGNSLSDNHGPSGGGLGLKDVDRAVIEGNRFINNHIGAQVDTSPREMGVENYFTDNVFAFNQIGIGFQPSVRHNTLAGNSFIDNTQHVAILGGGVLKDITWQAEGRGNYWSDYAGYDANGDGIGDVPYRSERLFESLMDRHPSFRLFQFSPAALAIDFAARAFPSVRPETKFEDAAPLMRPRVSEKLPPTPVAETGPRLVLGGMGAVAVLATAGALYLLSPRRMLSRRTAVRKGAT